MSRAGIGYRPIPNGFAETFERVGWDGICAELRAHRTTVKRWLVESGEGELQRRRRAWLEAVYGARGHRIGGVKPGRKLGGAGRRA